MGIFDQIETHEGRSQAMGAARDITNRGIAGLLGGPVDLVTLALKPFGYDHPAPVGSSEWIGEQMAKAGMVSADRYPLPEFLMSVALPGVAPKGAKGVGLLAEGLESLGGSAGHVGAKSLRSQLGVMSPEGEARLLADLHAGAGRGTFRLGDVTEGQGQGLDTLFGRPSSSRDVFMTNDALDHIVQRRMSDRQYTPEDVTRFIKSAMERRARPELDVAKSAQNPALRNTNVRDPVFGRPHDVFMPLKQVEGGYEVRSVYAPGLRPRSEKAPKR